MQHLIAPLAGTEFATEGTQQKIAAWEAAHNVKLPERYGAFLARFNGGYLYPNVFEVASDPAALGLNEREMFFDIAYSFDEALGFWRKETYADGTPQGYFFIGATPGGAEILMSLNPEDHGKIYLWFHSMFAWGSEGNAQANLIEQAANFETFIERLFDTEDRIGRAHWETPNAVQAAVSLEF